MPEGIMSLGNIKGGRFCAGLILSGCLNLMLAALLCVHPKPPAQSLSEATPEPRSNSNPAQDLLPGTADAQPLFVTNRFDWSFLESTNFEVYAANLRAIGCPQNTVEDIIVAAAERVCGRKRASLPQNAGFWSSGPRREAAVKEREQADAALESEQRDLLMAIIGKTGSQQSRHSSREFIELAIMHFLLGPVADGAAEQVLEAVERGSDLESQVRNQAGGVLLTEDEARLEEIRKQTLAELQRLLSPAQFEEFAARQAALSFIDSKFQDARVTPAELRTIALIHVSIFGALNDMPFSLWRNGDRPDPRQEEFEARLKAFLGDDRFAQYLGQDNEQAANSLKP
jgi:hypothetical protein